MADNLKAAATRIAAKGGIFVFIVMALEVVIMISPFAFFFYSVFNPLFHRLDQYTVTHWMTAFFLPHMILPPTPLLQGIRILGSILFVVGAVLFTICAAQVYLGKLFGWGVASRGIYRIIRHPQYFALTLWGIGMSILWPRFMVLVSLSAMCILYYILARDEESRMVARHGEEYERYRRSTGMFLPLFIERRLTWATKWINGLVPTAVAVPSLVLLVILGTGLVCREITVRSLPMDSRENVTLVSILPEDNPSKASALAGIINNHRAGHEDYLQNDKQYFGYLMRPDYVMQGMIADTGSDFHLFKHHQTVSMITEWILHPFEHLRTPPSAHMAKMHGVDPALARRHHCPLERDEPDMTCDECPYRRVVLVEVGVSGKPVSGADLLGINVSRKPAVALDVNIKTGEVVKVTEVGKSTAWHDVPTPEF